MPQREASVSASFDRTPLKVVVLISGSGTNLQSIIGSTGDFEPGVDIRAVISNNPDAGGLQRAKLAGIETRILKHRNFSDRKSYDIALMEEIDAFQPELVVLAGFMRILTTGFVNHYAGRLINIHPSLLPLYPGLNTHKRAIENGDSKAGATVHFVTAEVDGGPAIIQAEVPVLDIDTPQQLAARVLKLEHLIFPVAIKWFAQDRLSVHNGKVLLDGIKSSRQQVISNDK